MHGCCELAFICLSIYSRQNVIIAAKLHIARDKPENYLKRLMITFRYQGKFHRQRNFWIVHSLIDRLLSCNLEQTTNVVNIIVVITNIRIIRRILSSMMIFNVFLSVIVIKKKIFFFLF